MLIKKVLLGFHNYAWWIYIHTHTCFVPQHWFCNVIEFKLRQFTSRKLMFLLVVRELFRVWVLWEYFDTFFVIYIFSLNHTNLCILLYTNTKERERVKLKFKLKSRSFISKFARLIMNTIKVVQTPIFYFKAEYRYELFFCYFLLLHFV